MTAKRCGGPYWPFLEIAAAVRAYAFKHALGAAQAKRALEAAYARVGAIGRIAALAIGPELQHQPAPVISSMACRRACENAAKRSFTAFTVSGGAVSGRPALNGGAGAYSIINWIILATSSPARSATMVSAMSMPAVTPPPVMTLPSHYACVAGDGAEQRQ